KNRSDLILDLEIIFGGLLLWNVQLAQQLYLWPQFYSQTTKSQMKTIVLAARPRLATAVLSWPDQPASLSTCASLPAPRAPAGGRDRRLLPSASSRHRHQARHLHSRRPTDCRA